jgi:hypothetical protein
MTSPLSRSPCAVKKSQIGTSGYLHAPKLVGVLKIDLHLRHQHVREGKHIIDLKLLGLDVREMKSYLLVKQRLVIFEKPAQMIVDAFRRTPNRVDIVVNKM